MNPTLQRKQQIRPLQGDRTELDDERQRADERDRVDGADRAAQRRQRAIHLVVLVRGDRELLENLRARYWRRLHRTIDDPEAVEGLRTVEVALSMTSRSGGAWSSPRRNHDGRRRWWRPKEWRVWPERVRG